MNKNKNNFIILLAGVLILLITFFAYQLVLRGKINLNLADNATAKLEKQSTSTGLKSIEKDVNATDLSDIDKELVDIEKELNTLK